MIAYRDKLAREYKLQMVVGQNKAALDGEGHLPRQAEGEPER